MFRKIVKFFGDIFLKFSFKVEIKGKENYLIDEPFVMVANHRSALDVIVLFLLFNKNLYFMAKKELFNCKLFGYILKKLGAIPVDREKNDLKAIKNSMKVLKDGGVLGIFPEGHRNTEVDSDGAKAGAVMIAAKCQVPVIAVAIKSDYKFRSKIEVVLDKPYYFEKNKKYSVDECKDITKEIVLKIKRITEN